MKLKTFLFLLFTVVFCMSYFSGDAQLSAPGASGYDKTSYPVYSATDSIYVFCTTQQGQATGNLQANTSLGGTKTFLWEKYNNKGNFDFYFSESTDAQKSVQNNLADGCYRVTITQGANSLVYRAWVLNDWFFVSASIPVSNCSYFTLSGTHTTAVLKYYDLQTNAEIILNKQVKVQWITGNEVIATIPDKQVSDPPAKDTEYTFRVYDKYSCQGVAPVTYKSIVTKASFKADPTDGEAPLTVTFTNTSENGTRGQYEWFFFRDLNKIKEESKGSTAPVDSIEVVAYDDSPVYIYEYSGLYMVKLVSKKVNSDIKLTCVDTVYLKDYIKVDTSFVSVPNVFTPNGDGTNDQFVVKFWSMQSIDINIFNRWGKKVHSWASGDIRGFEGTWTETVWDGRLMGGRYASPGVYYYTVSGEGRDGKTRRAHGFFHLFRDKD